MKTDRSHERPAAFLDRDGVINVDHGYVHKPEDLEFIPGAPEAIRWLNEQHYRVIVVTNQAGVARGYYPESQIKVFHAHLQSELAKNGATIDAFYHCPFHADGVVPEYTVADHPDRKPNPGMILKALQDWPTDRRRSFMVGDKVSDVEAARAAGLPGLHFTEGRLDAFLRDALER